ncbi:MAG: TPP-binding protein [Acidimicrobiales bacterium]|nr:TPP-binding protein [Acidimicrobiales bacterium]
MTSLADLAIDALRKLEIDTLFCLPGVQNDDFFDRLVDARDIRPIVTRHEQGAAYMAMGYSQVTGRPSAFCVVPGPGMLNTTAALTSAYWSGGRVLGIIGAIATFQAGKLTGALHDLRDPGAVLRQVTKHAAAITSPEPAALIVQEAIDALMANEARPVAIEWPADLWNAEADGVLDPPRRTVPSIDPEQVETIAGILAASSSPLIIVGGGAVDAGPQITKLAETIQAPVFTRRQGHGVIDARHPLWVPITVGYKLWATADVALGIGTRLDFPRGWGTDDDLTIIQVNIDADELDRHDLGTVGLHADAAMGIDAITDALGSIPARRDRSVELSALRRTFEQETSVLNPQREVLAVLRDVLPDDGIVVEDVTQLGFAAHILFEFRHPRTFLTTGPAGTLGAGTAQAIGAQVGAGNRKVVGLIGDGGFLFTATELATAVQHQIPVTLVVHDNGAYLNVKRMQTDKFGPDRTIASTLTNPDFVKFGESFGVPSAEAKTPGEFRSALQTAIDHDGPSLVVLTMDEGGDPWPFLKMPRVRGKSAKP